jgi:plastocyanin
MRKRLDDTRDPTPGKIHLSSCTVVQKALPLGKPLSDGFMSSLSQVASRPPLIWTILFDRCKLSPSVDIAIATRDFPSCGNQAGYITLGRYSDVSQCTPDGSSRGDMARTMKMQRAFNKWSRLFLLSTIALLSCVPVRAQKKSKYACDQKQPETMCNAANTCGSPSSTCTISVARSNNSANVKPGIPNAKNNQFFCIPAGTTVVWTSSKKSHGFMVSFGTDSPFEPGGSIVGGGEKSVTTKARTPGCYKYDVGGFTSGTVYGMSGGRSSELVILP